MTIPRRYPGYITAIALFLTIVSAAQAQYSGGSGEPNDPYQIATAADLIALGETLEDYDKHFILTADIDLDPNLPGGRVFDRAVIAPDVNDIESGFQGSPFTGMFDGKGHTISRLAIIGKGCLGLFGRLASGAEVKDVAVLATNIVGDYYDVGALVAYNEGNVTQCHSTGLITNSRRVGGLVGYNKGTMIYCYSTCVVSSDRSQVGGLVGCNEGDVIWCHSTGAVISSNIWNSGSWYIGGLIGYNDYMGYVANCYSSSAVRGDDDVGGLVGHNEGCLTQCFSAGAVEGKVAATCVGGLTGINNFGSVTQCYSTGMVTNGYGLMGRNLGLVAHCYVSGGSGLMYDNNLGTVTGCFWDMETSGWTFSAGGIGKTTSQMQDIRTYLDAGWDFVGEDKNGNSEIWAMSPGGNYPTLAVFTGYTPVQLKGQGTSDDPYLVSSATDLGAVVHYNPSSHYRLVGLVDLFGIRWSTAIIPWFRGTFDGNGYTITNLTIEGESFLGLFGRLASGAEISDLGVVDVNITASGELIGALVGNNGPHKFPKYGGVLSMARPDGGRVTRCCSSGEIRGLGQSSYMGGLAGGNGGYIAQCYSTVVVSSAGTSIGGLVGHNSTEVIQSYSTGMVMGSNDVGGLLGSKAWYATASQCFWDMEVSGQIASAGGVGLTTSEMQTAGTFFQWGICGGEGTWAINEGADYPRLCWENQPGKVISNEPLSHFLAGSGTDSDPFLIDSPEQLCMVGLFPCEWDKHFRLTANIDLSAYDGKEGRPVYNIIAPDVDPCDSGFQGISFTGVFDGNGHIVSHLTISGRGYLGLFGRLGKDDGGLFDPHRWAGGHQRLESGAEIKNLGVVDVSIVGSDAFVGGLVAYNLGHVNQCFVTGTLSGSSDVGGIIGYNQGGISASYSAATVSGGDSVGGLVGQNPNDRWRGLLGFISNCYSTGGVSGNSDVGGLVGSGAVSAFYAYTTIPSFWDTETSSQTASSVGIGKTTAEMQMVKTYLDAGWDFVDEVDNGTEDIWWILEGQDYPRLWWEQ